MIEKFAVVQDSKLSFEMEYKRLNRHIYLPRNVSSMLHGIKKGEPFGIDNEGNDKSEDDQEEVVEEQQHEN